MISFFFKVRKSPKQLMRIEVESVPDLTDAAVKQLRIPAMLMFVACAVFDHKAGKWVKFALPYENFTCPGDVTLRPDDVKVEVDHTFFTMLGLAWHIVSDDRFYIEFRAACARFSEYQAALQMPTTCAEYDLLRDFLRNGCRGPVLPEFSKAYAYFPL